MFRYEFIAALRTSLGIFLLTSLELLVVLRLPCSTARNESFMSDNALRALCFHLMLLLPLRLLRVHIFRATRAYTEHTRLGFPRAGDGLDVSNLVGTIGAYLIQNQDFGRRKI